MAAKSRGRKNESFHFCESLLFRGNSVVGRSRAVKPGQTKSNRYGWRLSGSAASGQSHAPGKLMQILPLNDLQYNRGLSGAKPVKVCQSDCLGLQSASRRPAGAGFGRAAKAGVGANGGEIQDGSGLFREMGLEAWFRPGAGKFRPIRSDSDQFRPKNENQFPDQISTDTGNTATIWRPNQKQATKCLCNPLRLNTVTCCQLQPYLCNKHSTGIQQPISRMSQSHFDRPKTLKE